jgi:tetratricopeptide (TPR) repeat protein
MSNDNRPRSWKEKRDHGNKKNFIGRVDDLTAFNTSLTNPDPDEMIFSISGQGGVGKTTLLKEFDRIAKEHEMVVAYVDEGSQVNPITDVPETLNRLATELEAQGGKFEEFQKRYKTYRQKKQELEANPEVPGGIAAGVGKFIAKASLSSAKTIPGVSGVMDDLIDIDGAASKVGDLSDYLYKKFSNKDDVQLVLKPDAVLTPLWLKGVNTMAEQKTVVLLLDTHEQTGKFLDGWLRALLEEGYGDLTVNFRLCIAGRDPLNRNLWATLEQFIARSQLEPFTEAETRQYLTQKGITSEDVIVEILRLAGNGSGGSLPALVSMMAQSAPTSPNAVVDRCEDAVERFLKWETDEKKRQLARIASVPRILNADVIEVLAEDQFDWLKTCDFVIEHPEGWQYHSVVRELMLRYQRKESPRKWEELHKKFAEYYDELREGLELTDTQQQTNKTWQKHTLEWLYHSLCASPLKQIGMALNGWLMAFNAENEREFPKQWAETMRMAGNATDSEDIKRWSNQFLNGLQCLKDNSWSEIYETLSGLSKEPLLEDNCRAIALVSKVFCLLECTLKKGEDLEIVWGTEGIPDLSEVIEALNHAINLVPNKGEFFLLRGLSYYSGENFDNGKSDFRQALEFGFDELDDELKKGIESLIDNIERNVEQREEIQRLEIETQNMKEENQRLERILESKTTIEQEFVQNIRRVLNSVDWQGTDSQRMKQESPTLQSECQRVSEFFEIRMEEIRNLKASIQIRVKDSQSRTEETQKMYEEFQRKAKEVRYIQVEYLKLLEVFKEKEARIMYSE